MIMPDGMRSKHNNTHAHAQQQASAHTLTQTLTYLSNTLALPLNTTGATTARPSASPTPNASPTAAYRASSSTTSSAPSSSSYSHTASRACPTSRAWTSLRSGSIRSLLRGGRSCSSRSRARRRSEGPIPRKALRRQSSTLTVRPVGTTGLRRAAMRQTATRRTSSSACRTIWAG